MLDAAIKAGADAFITGEMSYHEYFGHEQEIQICVIGHYQSEQFTGEIFRSIIQENFPRCQMLHLGDKYQSDIVFIRLENVDSTFNI